jgi:type IV pilus assembly protein PilC
MLEIFKKFKQARVSRNVKISSKEKINFLDQLWNLLQSWIPIINSIKIIIYQTKNKKIKDILNEIINKLNKWDNLATSFNWYPKIFWIFDISIVEMWEITWKLWDSIETIKSKEEKAKELKWKIIWALIYPIVIICLSLIMIWVFMIYVIPKVQQMYSDSKVNLPTLTQKVIDLSEFIQANIVYIIIWTIVFIILLIVFKTNKLTKIYWDNMILRIPIFGKLIKKKILALFTSSLWILLQNWIIINKSLEISAKALENDYYERELTEIISRVSKWIELSTLMWINEIQSGKENFLFPIELSSVVKIWEETWNLANLLVKISNKMNREIDSIVKNIQTAIEPIVIILVGWIVWVLIMAIMLPFFNMVNVI